MSIAIWKRVIRTLKHDYSMGMGEILKQVSFSG